MHNFLQSICILLNYNARDISYTNSRSKILLQFCGLGALITQCKSFDIFNIASTPLINRLVVITDDSDIRSQFMQNLNQRFFNRIYVLVLINDDNFNSFFKSLSQI